MKVGRVANLGLAEKKRELTKAIILAHAINGKDRLDAIKKAVDALQAALSNTDYDLRIAVEDVISELREAL